MDVKRWMFLYFDQIIQKLIPMLGFTLLCWMEKTVQIIHHCMSVCWNAPTVLLLNFLNSKIKHKVNIFIHLAFFLYFQVAEQWRYPQHRQKHW